MAGSGLYGWFGDPIGDGVWRKLVCNAEGKLIIDPSEIFENDPTDDEHGKAPDSDWAHDHKADVAAHHAKFTIVEHDTPDRHGLANLDTEVCSEAEAAGLIEDHRLVANAHHDKYTNLEAQTACRLNGTLYWSCAGIHFDPTSQDVDDVEKSATGYIEATGNGIFFHVAVFLPNGATITKAIVFGNAGASAEVWELQRITLSGGATSVLAGAAINTEDTSITTPIVDNATYAYYFNTSSFDIGDRIYGARITYTL